MITFIDQLIYTSCMMAVIALLYVLAGALKNGKYFAGDFYFAGKMILFGFLIPFRPRIKISFPAYPGNRLFSEDAGFLHHMIKTSLEKPESDGTAFIYDPTAAVSPVRIVFFLWLVGFSVILLCHVIKYVCFKRTVERWSEDIRDRQLLEIFSEIKGQLGISSHVRLKRCSCISSPMLVQVLRPVLLLTDNQMTKEDLKLILQHEMIHLKRKDLWYKWAMLLAAAINWFNPAVYVFSKAFNSFCELSCDEMVTENMPEAGRYQYSMIILRLAGSKAKSNTFFSPFVYGGKNHMKNRLYSIMNTGKKRWETALFAVCFLSICIAGMVLEAPANEPETINTVVLQADTYRIKTEEEIDREIEEAFSEVFSSEFNEENFPGMIITYDKNGIPIVNDPAAPKKIAVCVCGRYEKNGFYASSDCSDSNLVFYVPEGRPIEALDSTNTTTVVKVKYAGTTGYMIKSELRF